MDAYTKIKLTIGALCTIGLYSVLYRETKLYRFFEHIFLGLAAGYAIVILWTETLYPNWWTPMVGATDETSNAVTALGYWPYVFLLPIGLMGYMVFSRKNNWMSRIPIGIIIGLWSGQQIMNWWNTYGPQIFGSMKPIFPTTWDSFTRPVITPGSNIDPAVVAANIYPSQALTNLVFIITLISAFCYFIFSFEIRSKGAKAFNNLGRWLLMIGFGAIFGSTVMARFALVIDRMAFLWLEWLQALTG